MEAESLRRRAEWHRIKAQANAGTHFERRHLDKVEVLEVRAQEWHQRHTGTQLVRLLTQGRC